MPLNRGNQKGYRFLQEAKQYLEQKGCLVLYANGFNGIDLIVFNPALYKAVYFVKCKYGGGKIDKTELVKFTKFAHKYDIVPIYCSRKPTTSIAFMNMNTTTDMNFVDPR